MNLYALVFHGCGGKRRTRRRLLACKRICLAGLGMPPAQLDLLREPIDPFCIIIRESEAGQVSLLNIATEKAHVPLTDLRRLNPHLDGIASHTPLLVGTRVQLPIITHQQGKPFGLTYHVGDAEEQLQHLNDTLDGLIAWHEGSVGALPSLPPRSVFSKTEQVIETIHREAQRQLPHIEKMTEEMGTKDQQLHYLVEVEAVRQKGMEVEHQFSPSKVRLQSFLPENSVWIQAPHRRISENHLTAASTETVTDNETDFCVGSHTHRWEVVMCRPHSLDEQDAWAVLSCQRLTALIDAFTCSSALPFPTSRNAFLFIGGVFFVDDRHAQTDPYYEDLSESIRFMDPAKAESAIEGSEGTFFQGKNLGFGRCKVRSAYETTFADLHIKQGEFCVLRHLGQCTHYFYFQGVRSLRDCSRVRRCQFPHRIMQKRELVLRCKMCHQFPSTIAVYNDALSPEQPTVYCTACFELLHGMEDDTAASTYLKVELGRGQYFKY